MIWVTRYLLYAVSVANCEVCKSTCQLWPRRTLENAASRKVFTTRNGAAWFDLIKSESSNAFEAGAKDKRLHSSRKEFWIGLAKDTLSYQQISTEQIPFLKKTSLSLVQSYKNQRLSEILYAFMYQTGFCSYNLKQAILDVPVSSKRCRQGKRRTTWPCSTRVVRARSARDENFSGLAAVSLVVFNAMPFIYYETSTRKISKPESSTMKSSTKSWHSSWVASKNLGFQQYHGKFPRNASWLAMVWAKNLTTTTQESYLYMSSENFRRLGWKMRVFFEDVHSHPSPPHNS